MINIFHTAPASVVASLQDAIARHERLAVAVDTDGNLHFGPAGGDVMRDYERNHPHLTVTTYTRSITARDLLADLACRLDELSTYGKDRKRKHR